MITAMLRKSVALAFASLAACAAQAQERIAVPLSDASRPAVLEVHAFRSAISVTVHDGKEVVIVAREATPDEVEPDDEDEDQRERERERERDDGDDEAPNTAGLRRVPNTSIGLTATEENNTVSVKTDFSAQALALDISVPRNTSVRVHTVNGGDLKVTGVSGEHELSNVNGSITANDIAGSLVASCTNGAVRATFTEVTAGKAMSFNTFNGDLDVTFPANLSATLRVNSGRGEFFTDFDVAVQANPPVVEQGGRNGRYEVRLERETVAAVGRGGPDIRFKTFNGDIMVRKR
jgi:putative adhesin